MHNISAEGSTGECYSRMTLMRVLRDAMVMFNSAYVINEKDEKTTRLEYRDLNSRRCADYHSYVVKNSNYECD